MQIRSITLFCTPDFSTEQAKTFFTAAADDALPVPLQTHRVAFPPFPGWWQRDRSLPEQADALSARWRDAGANYLSLGPVQLAHDEAWIELLPDLLGRNDMLFASAEVANVQGHIDPQRCRAVAGVIRQASTLIDNGFGNLYFTALANCAPGSPFFPVAYHDGGHASFAFAVEAADVAVEAFKQAATLEAARDNLVQAIERETAALVATGQKLAAEHDLTFGGIDFSLAPFPEEARSLGLAMELLGIPTVGGHGALFAAALITEAVERARFPRCGFSGLMLPVLEDTVLAQRAAESQLSITDLLSYAAVCGTGLDTIPLPGDTSEEVLAAILLDVAALATRLDKPLTARLMPLPGLQAGDATNFDFPYFANSRVMAIREGRLSKPLEGAPQLQLGRYQPRS
jgi:uncharacterized protein (UPF0210 family)